MISKRINFLSVQKHLQTNKSINKYKINTFHSSFQTTMQQQTILHTLQCHVTASPQARVIITVYITTTDHITAMPNYPPLFTFKHILSHFQYWEGIQLQTQHTFTQKSRTQQWPIKRPINQLEPSSIQTRR